MRPREAFCEGCWIFSLPPCSLCVRALFLGIIGAESCRVRCRFLARCSEGASALDAFETQLYLDYSVPTIRATIATWSSLFGYRERAAIREGSSHGVKNKMKPTDVYGIGQTKQRGVLVFFLVMLTVSELP